MTASRLARGERLSSAFVKGRRLPSGEASEGGVAPPRAPHAHSHTPPSPLSPAPALRFETTPATRRLCPPDPSMPLLVGIPPPCPCHVVPQKLGKGMKTWNLDQRKTHDTCHRPYHDACHGALHGAREPSLMTIYLDGGGEFQALKSVIENNGN